jgi:hypothetical protein
MERLPKVAREFIEYPDARTRAYSGSSSDGIPDALAPKTFRRCVICFAVTFAIALAIFQVWL